MVHDYFLHLPIIPSAVSPIRLHEGGRIRFKYDANDTFSRFAAGPFPSELFPFLPATGTGLLYRLEELNTIAVHGSDARLCKENNIKIFSNQPLYLRTENCANLCMQQCLSVI